MAFDNLKNLLGVDIKDGLPGKAVVQSSSVPNRGATSYNVEMWLDVYVEGWEPYRVKHHCMVKATKHPHPGTTLPVVVDRENRERLDIQWDQVPTVDEMMAAGGPESVINLQGTDAGEQIRALLAQHGVQPDESGSIQLTGENAAALQQQIMGIVGAATGQQVPGQPESDPVEQLERLAKLHEQGALSDEEFEAAKKRVLGEL